MTTVGRMLTGDPTPTACLNGLMNPSRRTQIRITAALLLGGLLSSLGYTYYREVATGEAMTQAGSAFVTSLDAEQQKTAVLEYANPERMGWHFIPKDHRKGLQVKHMTPAQQKAAHHLLRSALSEAGYSKATRIMDLENLLNELEGGKGRNIRDSQRYYFTLFGQPTDDGRWGLSVEGHHLSLNFVVEKGKVISSTPQFFATNPAVVKTKNSVNVPVGTRVLAQEELLAFELVNSLSAEQAKVAIIADKAPAEIREAGSVQPPQDAPAGIGFSDLTAKQQSLVQELVLEYCSAMTAEVAGERLSAIRDAGWDKVSFCWAGAKEEGIGHYYRVQGPTFLIELVNTQPDAAGNPANHIHCVWRDMKGDFANPL
ncbi:MAG: DUF3500 domain-containing protein [Planctomycetaceae bacterium]|nr:DUF3500 domain-containing protein [Planctomycetaceae bacterium]